jgi:serine phosphatase RsbU (regulator of sigma subunit)
MDVKHKHKADTGFRVGLPLAAHFALTMSIALAIVSAASNFFLFEQSQGILAEAQEEALSKALLLSSGPFEQQIELKRLSGERAALESIEEKVAKAIEDTVRLDGPSAQVDALTKLQQSVAAERDQRVRAHDELAAQELWQTLPGRPEVLGDGSVTRAEIQYGPDGAEHGAIYSYQPDERWTYNLLIPGAIAESGSNLFGLFVGATFAIIAVAALASVWVASRVSRPLEALVDDVRHISAGDLHHRTHAQGSGEVVLLARSIDRMTNNLLEARENEIELQVRTREVELAAEIRGQLLPQTTPEVPGYAVGHLHIASTTLGGDFHDLLEIGAEERPGVGLLVCEISGKGAPAALVGATARAYLRSRLADGGDLKEALQDVNRQLVRDVPRGVSVSSLYALLDPAQALALVTCTGHKLPLIRYTGADKKVRLIHPEGIAMGFDKGPVFNTALEVAKVPIAPGDRLVLVNSGAVTIANAEGAELGEKAFYTQIMRLGGLPTEAFLSKLREALEAYRGEAALVRDVSVLTLARL